MERVGDVYAAAGVDIAAGDAAVSLYKKLAAGWRHRDQLDELGGFAGLFRLPGDPSRALVASTDGVGTKVLIAKALGRYDTVGADLVNHCVNDILVSNATPLFFLDYLATARLVPDVAAAIVGGVHRACKENDVA
ncbi:MAG: phosphoribosylformylglycinamidine cyclo-ligase, partial [Candidatus Eremiobacteraeota bacterium]|nr:phosphoribosylformylglycinamidine cyclo-ligase [Candidatus Eremiobacteraeota bacterium]